MSNFGHCALIGCLSFGAVAVTRIHIFNKSVSILLIIGFRGLQCTVNLYENIYAANLLVVSDLSLDHSLVVKLWRLNIKVPVSCLFVVLDVCNVQ